LPSIKYIWISLWNHGHRLDKNNIWLLPYCLSPILVPIIHPVHTIAALVTQLMLTVHSIMYLLLYFHIIAFSQHSPAIPYHTAYIYMRMYLDSQSSMTMHYTVPCRYCMLTYLVRLLVLYTIYRTMQTLHAYVFRPLVLYTLFTG
jgi:hypothetical protein